MVSGHSHGGGEDGGGRKMLIANIFAQRLFGVNKFTSPTSLFPNESRLKPYRWTSPPGFKNSAIPFFLSSSAPSAAFITAT